MFGCCLNISGSTINRVSSTINVIDELLLLFELSSDSPVDIIGDECGDAELRLSLVNEVRIVE